MDGGNGKQMPGQAEAADPASTPVPTRVDRGSAILRREGNEVTLTDLDTAGYIYFAGAAYIRGKQIGPTEYEIVFYDPERAVEALVVEFTNDKCSRYADAIRRLKKVIVKPPRSQRGYRF